VSKLPLLLSVPHAGLDVPPEVADLCVLTPEQIAADGDGGAAEIYRPLRDDVELLVTTDVARAIVDQNRAEDDRRADGIVKTHTCWQEPVYREALSDELAEALIDRYHRPYHRALAAAAAKVPFALDCHTMAAEGPPIGPDPGVERPLVCLGSGQGSCSEAELAELARCFEDHLGVSVALNQPFSGGYITRSRPGGIRWAQIELSRAAWTTFEAKTRAIRAALGDFCSRLGLR
jgi:formiminoglutamase